MDLLTLSVFLAVYTGMIVGGLPGLALDRTGVVLLGAIALLLGGRVSPEEAWLAVDVPTMALLFGLMVVSAQFRLGGFYSRVTHRIAASDSSPRSFLLVVLLTAGGLSALLANDIICLAMTPILLEICQRRGLRPMPFLMGLACASNIGSAATLIGNPQNMLIGQVLQLSFAVYLLKAIVPAVAGLLVTWWIILAIQKGNWEEAAPVPVHPEVPDFNLWQTGKGLAVLTALVVVFLWAPIPREVAALAAAGLLLLSRRMASGKFLALVDWNLLLLFLGLFIVNHTLESTGLLEQGLAQVRSAGLNLDNGPTLYTLTVILSNLVSNVPAVMLLLPSTAHPDAGLILALSSTLAGNLILVGSIANLIVVDQAGRLGYRISWADHARYGVPVTLATLVLTAAWVFLVV